LPEFANGGILCAMANMSWQGNELTVLGIDGPVDVVVVGGGLAGLAGALTLVRARRSVIPRRAIVVAPQFEARRALLDSLGVSVAEHPLGIGHQVAADATGRTAAAGVWVAGNAADVTAGVMQAAASGVTAAAAINVDLTVEDTTAAVAARRPMHGIEV
jgi:thioredoxin reductase